MTFVVGLVALGMMAGCGAPGLWRSPSTGAKIPRVGFLSPGSASESAAGTSPSKEAFLRGLRDLGYVDGQNVTIEYRFTEGRDEALPGLAAELVALPVDVVVALGTTRVRAMKDATQTVPIVMAAVADPIEAGLVASLARPGGNVTGVSTLSSALAGKRLELLQDAAPRISRVAVLSTPRWSEATSSVGLQWRGVHEGAKLLGVEVRLIEARDEGSPEATRAGLKSAIDAAVEEGADALFPLSDALFDIWDLEIGPMATARRLPSIYGRDRFVNHGGLMSYGANPIEQYRRVAVHVDRIIKGTRPADLPVEQPMAFDFVVNLNTARTLGLTFEPTFLGLATRIVQ